MLNIWSKKKKSLDKECLIVAPYVNSLFGLIAEEIFESLPRAFYQSHTKEKIRINANFFLSGQTADPADSQHNLQRILTSKSHDLVFAVGMQATMAIKHIYAKHRISTPVVFSGVTNPVAHGLTRSLGCPSPSFSGIAADASSYYDEHIDFLFSLACSAIKQVIIVKSSEKHHKSSYELAQIRAAFQRADMAILQEITLDDSPQSLEYLASQVPTADLVFMPRQTGFTRCTRSIAAICNQYDVPFYASDIASVENGALFAYTTKEKLTGHEVALKAIPLLYDLQKPQQMPVDPVKRHDSFVIINEKAIESQGGKLKEMLRTLLSLHHNLVIRPYITRYDDYTG